MCFLLDPSTKLSHPSELVAKMNSKWRWKRDRRRNILYSLFVCEIYASSMKHVLMMSVQYGRRDEKRERERNDNKINVHGLVASCFQRIFFLSLIPYDAGWMANSSCSIEHFLEILKSKLRKSLNVGRRLMDKLRKWHIYCSVLVNLYAHFSLLMITRW